MRRLTKNIQYFHILEILVLVQVGNSFAGTGDELVITGDIVNFRTAPSINAEITAKLPRGSKLIEIQRQGEWVEVETGRKDIKTGWVHETLIFNILETQTKSEHEATLPRDNFNKFMQTFNDQKERITDQVGAVYFANARFKNEVSIDLIATDAWLNAGIEERHNALSKVLDIWSGVNPDANSILVRVYDVQGEQHMTMMLR